MNKPLEYTKWRSNDFRQQRESWCVERFCQLTAIQNPQIIYEESQNSSVDVWLHFEGKKFKIQVTEIAPRSSGVMQTFDSQMAGMPFFGLSDEVGNLINTEIKNKESKNYSDANELNLLIYLNGPHEIIFDPELDIDLPSLQSANCNSVFSSIILLMDENVFYLKGKLLHV